MSYFNSTTGHLVNADSIKDNASRLYLLVSGYTLLGDRELISELQALPVPLTPAELPTQAAATDWSNPLYWN